MKPDSRLALLPLLLPYAALAAASLGTAKAQAPSPWQDLQVPSGVSAAQLEAKGKLVLYRDGSFLRVYSAATNQWHAHTPSSGTVPRLAKDLLLVPESDRVTAFSAYRGRFEVKLLNWAASTLTFADSVACVVEGTQVHTFSAFTGTWQTRPLPSGWLLELHDRIVLLRTPAVAPQLQASAFDAYTGQWHDLPPQATGLFGRQLTGSAVVVSTQLQHSGFSPLRPGWVQAPVAGSFPFPFDSPYNDGTDLVANMGTLFSGLTGTFASPPAAAWAGADVQRNVASGLSGVVGSPWHFIGASRNVWMPLPAGATTRWVDGGVALAMVGSTFHAFSPVLGTLTPLPWHNQMGARGAIGTVAWVVEPANNLAHVFSARTGQWHQTPAGTTQANLGLARSSVLATTTTGLAGFASRTGQWTPTAGTGLVSHNGFAASNATSLRVFDARTGRWQIEAWQGAGAAPPVFGERTMLAADATHAFGYGLRGGRLAATPLPEPPLELRVGDDVACVRTATHLLAFSGLGETLAWQAYPDDDFGVGIGTTARLQNRAANGNLLVLVFGPPATVPFAFPPFGNVWTDLAASVLLAASSPAGESRHVQDITIPDTPVLRGSHWFLQSLTLTPGGGGWLGEPAELAIQ